MMDFYTFLPSNASPDVYPNNKTSHFQIELSKRLELHGQWQAALIELHYPNTIAHVSPGDNEIKVTTATWSDSAPVEPGTYQNRDDFLQAVAVTLGTLSNKIQSQNAIHVREDERIVIQALTDERPSTVLFSPPLALQLGLGGPGPFPAHELISGVKPVDLSLGITPQMYIYMDVLADQIIGHTRAPLLRTVPVDITARYGSMSLFHCEHPLYFDLNTKSFDTLKIDIRDTAGRLVPFDYGTLTLLVHFRPLHNGS